MTDTERAERLSKWQDGPAEVVVAIRRGEGVIVYEGLADRIDLDFDYDRIITTDGAGQNISAGTTMRISFVGSMQKLGLEA